MARSYAEDFARLVPRYLDRPWTDADGIPADGLDAVLRRHAFPVPQVLREFYLALGRCDALMEAHNFFWDPEELEIEGGYLIFLDEEHEVVNWGFPVENLAQVDPIVWQRVNIDPKSWHSEEAHFSLFVDDMYEWVFDPERS